MAPISIRIHAKTIKKIMGADKNLRRNWEPLVLPTEPMPNLYPFPALGGKDIIGSYAISARALPRNMLESGQILAMETQSSPIDSTRAPLPFSASSMDTGRRHGTLEVEWRAGSWATVLGRRVGG
jgi:hypothetical protein